MVSRNPAVLVAVAVLVAAMLPEVAHTAAVRAEAHSTFDVAGTVRGAEDLPGRSSLRSGTVRACDTSPADAGCDHVAVIAPDGAFAIAGLASDGAYSIGVTPPGGSPYPAGLYAAGLPGSYTTGDARATDVTVDLADVPIDIVVPRGYVIAGSVAGDDGAPLAGARVSVGPATEGTSPPMPEGLVGEDGTFSVGPFLPGTYSVSVEPPAASDHPCCFFFSSGSIGNVAVAWGASTAAVVGAVDVSLPRMTIPRGYAIRGRVVGADGGSLAAGQVIATCTDDPTGCISADPAEVDTDGSFEIRRLLPGSYGLTISAPNGSGYLDGDFTADEKRANFTIDPSAASGVTVGSADVDLPTIAVPRGLTLTGVITGEGGGSLAGQLVVATCTSSVSAGGASATVAPDGSFAFTALAPGSYVVRIRPSASPYPWGYYSASTASRFTADPSRATEVAVTSSDVDLDTATVPVGHAISGRIYGDGDVRGMAINACVPLPEAGGCDWVVEAFTGVNPDGTFRLAPLAPGAYRLVFSTAVVDGRVDGYYAESGSGHWTTDEAEASMVLVGDQDVALAEVGVPATPR